MLSQLAHAVEFSNKNRCLLFVDWRNILYSSRASLMDNLFGKFIFCEEAKPVEFLFPFLENEEKIKIENFNYDSNVDSNFIHKFMVENVDSRELFEDKKILILTGPVHVNNRKSFYEYLRKIKFHQYLTEKAIVAVEDFDEVYGAIHYRHGNGEFSDYLSFDDHLNQISCIKEMYDKKFGNKKFSIYISTDSPEADKIFENVFHGFNLKFSPKEEFNFDGPSHYAPLIESDNDANMFALFESAVRDVLIMSKSAFIFRDAWSSFSDYSCSLASTNEGFQEIYYPVKRKKFNKTSYIHKFKEASRLIFDRNK